MQNILHFHTIFEFIESNLQFLKLNGLVISSIFHYSLVPVCYNF